MGKVGYHTSKISKTYLREQMKPMKVGILGGGQLGRMLLQAGANYPAETYVLEKDADCPAAALCQHFVSGDIRDRDTVYRFGKMVDALTIEIESVNVDALDDLEKEGLAIFPRPAVIRLIQNKIKQKEFYRQEGIPSPDFVVTPNRAALQEHQAFLPAVHKIGEGGYDGKGVVMLHHAQDLDKGFDQPAVLEKKCAIAQEISLIVGVSRQGETVVYPPAEMVVNPDLNLLDYQLSPARLAEKTLWMAEAIALKLVRAFNSPGLFAVEMFVDPAGEVWVNETAPRVHNSGHHSIEGNYSSQYDQLWRIILGYPLGNTAPILPAAIVNLIGEEGHSGPACYEGLEEVLKMDNAFVHLYGKTETKPGRKMGHVTLLSNDYVHLTHLANRVKHALKVKTAPKSGA